MKKKKKSRVNWRDLCHKIGLDFLLHITPIIMAEKRTVEPGNALNDIALMVLFEIVKV
jgi:hypothetical protein